MMLALSRTALAFLAIALSIAPRSPREDVDLLVRGGIVIDGTGTPGRIADVAVRGDRIVFIGDASGASLTPKRTIDARGLVLAPGFIDAHTHTQGDLGSADARQRANLAYLMQGVTTVVTNNDGGGDIDIGKTLGAWTKNGIGTNAALFVPQGSVRNAVLGMSDATPTSGQLDSMRAIVKRGMEQGAIGMSTGLYYAPGSYASTDEVIDLAKIAAQYGGIYDTHLRDESSYTIGLIGAVNETIRIGREAKIPVHISHIKALGTDVWGQSDSVIALMRAARASGIEATACQYPYTASGSSVGASLLPRWAEVGGRDSLRARIADPATRARLTSEMERNLVRRGGASSLLISSTRDTTILGKTLEQIATARRESPIDAALQIVQQGDASVASFNMNEKDIEKFMVQDFITTCSDGSAGHPRKYGTFPKLLHEYVFVKHVLTLPQAIRRSSATPAAILRLPHRGVLAVGNYADVIAFDSATVRDRSTYQQPTLLAVGMKYVLVNGTLAIDRGNYTGALGGKALKRSAE